MPIRESAPMSLRDREIAEILDEDLKSYKEVFKRSFHQARLLNESYAPPNRFERAIGFQIDKYFSELLAAIDITLESGHPADADQVLSLYSQLIDYIQRYTDRNTISQRDIAIIEDKFDTLKPGLYHLSGLAEDEDWRQLTDINAIYGMVADKVYLPIKWETSQVPPHPPILVDRSKFQYKASKRGFSPPPIDLGKPRASSPPPTLRRSLPPAPTPTSGKQAATTPAPASPPPATKKPSNRPSYVELDKVKTLMKGVATDTGFALPADFSGIYSKPRLTEIYIDMMEADRTNKSEVRKAKDEFNRLVDRARGAPASFTAPPPYQSPGPGAAPSSRPTSPTYYGYASSDDEGSAAKPQGFGMGENVILSVGEKKKHKKKRHHKTDRFQPLFGGFGDTEGEMGGLPAGFNRGLELRQVDRQPIQHFADMGLGGLDKDLTLQQRMYFLNSLEKHSVPQEEDEWKMNSTQNLRKATDHRIKKLK